MTEIMSNVHRIMARYSLDFDLPSGHRISLTEHMRKQRSLFLERMGTYSKNAENREKILAYILAWLEEWNVILSEITAFDVEEHYHWIVQMEMFPETLRAIENNVNILCSISTTFLNDKKTQKKKTVSRGALWKTWKDRFIKRPATALALRPDQMISDQFTTNTKVLEIQRMLQELIGSSMFNKMENTAIKYISATILNLYKALSAVCDQVNVSNIVSDSMFFEKYETEKELSRRMICDLSEQNELLQRKLQEREETYEQLIQSTVRAGQQEYTSVPTSRTHIKAGDIADSMDNILAKELENTLYKSPTKNIKSSEVKWGSSLLLKAPAVLTPDLPGQQYHPPEDHQQMGPGPLKGTADLKTLEPTKQQKVVSEENEAKLSQGLKRERQLELNTNAAPPFTESSQPGAPPVYPQPHPKYKPLTPLKTQALMTTLTPQQAEALGTTLTPQQAQALMTTLTTQQAQALGTTLTTQQAEALRTTLTPQQAQTLGTTLIPPKAKAIRPLTPQLAQDVETMTPQLAQALGKTLTPQQAQALGTTLTHQQAQALGTTVTHQKAQALGTSLTLQQAQALGTSLTLQQAQAVGTTLTLEQAQAMGTTLTLQQDEGMGTTLTPQQAQVVGTTLTHLQAQAVGTTLTNQQAQAMGTTLTLQQAQARGTTLTNQQGQGMGTTLTHLKAQAVGTTLTNQQAQAVGTTLTLQQAQAVGTTVTPQQAQAVGTSLTLQQAQALGTSLTLQQAQAVGTTLTLQQAQAVGTTLTDQQAQALGTSLTLQQAQAVGTTLTLQQAQALGTSLTNQQGQGMGTTLTHLKAQAVGTTLTHQQAQALETTLSPQEAHTLGTTLTPKQAQAVGTSLTLQQAQALGTSLTLQQAQAVGTTLTDQQAQALGTSLTTLQAQDLGITQALALRTTLAPHHTQTQGAHLTPDTAPPTPGQPLELEAVRPKQDFPQTARPPPPMKAPLTPRWPIRSGTTSTSTKSPGLHGPLSPGQSLAPGPPSFPGALLESGPSSAQPPAHQPPVSIGQPPSLQAPSALAQHLAPPTLPGETSSWIAPGSAHPSTSWTPSAAGMPQKGVASSGRKKGLVRIASQKLVQPSPPGWKRDLTPLIASKPSAETQTPQESSPMELQSHLSSDSTPTSCITYTDGGTLQSLQKPKTSLPSLAPQLTPASQVPFTNEGVLHTRQRSRMALPSITAQLSPPARVPFTNEEILHTRQKPRTSLPSATPQISKTSQKPLSQWASKSQHPSLDTPRFMKPASDINKDKMMVPHSSPKELEGRMYFVDVKAQRKNLMLLNQALTTNGLPSPLHTTARNLIIETLHTDQVRLGYLFHKYTAHRLIQRFRNYIICRVKATRDTGKGYEMQKLYVMLSKIDGYQKRVMHVWTEKQKLLEEKRNQCLRKMIPLFGQLQETYKLNLSRPIPLHIHKKKIPPSREFVQQTFQQQTFQQHTFQQPPAEEDMQPVKNIRHQDDQMDAIWKTDICDSSYPITEKTPTNVPWDQLGGYPDIPRLLELDIQSTFRKSLASIKTRIKKTPK
ncbi:protein FAM186A isoform X3 [Oryctolagus cuniculus]